MKIHKRTHTHTHTKTHTQIQKCSMIKLMFNFKFKLFRYISQIDILNSLPSFIAKKVSVKCFVEKKYLALILSEESSDDTYSPS